MLTAIDSYLVWFLLLFQFLFFVYRFLNCPFTYSCFFNSPPTFPCLFNFPSFFRSFIFYVISLPFICSFFLSMSFLSVEFSPLLCSFRLFFFSFRSNSLKLSSHPTTLPKTECWLFRCLHDLYVMKNCDPVVFGPELAMLSTPRLSCVMRDSNSSLILPPQRLSPPFPLPEGSPPCAFLM